MCPMVRRPPAMELALLGFLRQGPQHGYQIHVLLSDPAGLGPIWRLKQSQLYALLTKLEKDGYIWGELEPQAAARPPRRMYQLTITGQTAYQNWLRTPVNAPRLMRQEFMAKYYFTRMEGQVQVKELIDTQRATCLLWLETLHAEQAAAASTFSQEVYRYRLGQMEAALAWLDSCLQELLD